MFNMLSSLVVALALSQAPGLPKNYIGVWVDRSDRAIMVCTPTYIEYIEGEQWGSITGIYQAPNKDYVGSWVQSKGLVSEQSGAWPFVVKSTRWPDPVLDPYKDYKTPALGILAPDNARYTGEFRMKVAGGHSTFTRHDSKGIIAESSTFGYIGAWADAKVGGAYQDNLARLDIQEDAGASNWKAKGAFSYDGKKYIAEGERLFTRGRLNLIDETNGRVVGYLAYGYSPTSAKVKAFRSGNWGPTDSILINFVVPGSPTVQVRRLAR
jgi:hypothetical protein